MIRGVNAFTNDFDKRYYLDFKTLLFNYSDR
jgi:hypothetical protein